MHAFAAKRLLVAQALKKTTEAEDWHTGGDPTHERKLPGGTKYEPITLEQGLTHDPVFENWTGLVNNIRGDTAISLRNYRKDTVINGLNLQGQVSHYRQGIPHLGVGIPGPPDFDAGSTSIMSIRTIKPEHKGWEHDTAFSEPTRS